MLHPQGPRGETQEWPDEGLNDEGQIFDDVLEASLQRIFHERNEEGIGNATPKKANTETGGAAKARLISCARYFKG